MRSPIALIDELLGVLFTATQSFILAQSATLGERATHEALRERVMKRPFRANIPPGTLSTGLHPGLI
jgi:hypothetical protein